MKYKILDFISNIIMFLIFLLSLYIGYLKTLEFNKHIPLFDFNIKIEYFEVFCSLLIIFYVLKIGSIFIDKYLIDSSYFNALKLTELVNSNKNILIRFNYKLYFIIFSFSFLSLLVNTYFGLNLSFSLSSLFLSFIVFLRLHFKKDKKELQKVFINILESDVNNLSKLKLKFGKNRDSRLEDIDSRYLNWIENTMTYELSSTNRRHFTKVKSYPFLINELNRFKNL